MTTGSCPACEAARITSVCRIESIPVVCNALHDSAQGARAAPRAPMDLTFCESCGHLFNAAFDPRLIVYGVAYENALHFSPYFREYADGLARSLVERYGLRDSHIVELGCGDGTFLSTLCKMSGSRGTGYDPAFDPARAPAHADPRVRIEPIPYGPQARPAPADLICCRHVLEHIHRPREFLDNVVRTIGDRDRTAVFFEVPDARFTLEQLGIWDLIYEHCSYFTRESLASLFRSAGMQVAQVESVYGGQFLTLHARKGRSEDAPVPIDSLRLLIGSFAAAYRRKTAEWRDRLRDFAARGQSGALWGAGSKGVSFLNVLGDDVRAIRWVVDVNPRKQGRFVSGTGHGIIGPQGLRENPPAFVVLMNPVYRDEVQGMLTQAGAHPQLMIA